MNENVIPVNEVVVVTKKDSIPQNVCDFIAARFGAKIVPLCNAKDLLPVLKTEKDRRHVLIIGGDFTPETKKKAAVKGHVFTEVRRPLVIPAKQGLITKVYSPSCFAPA